MCCHASGSMRRFRLVFAAAVLSVVTACGQTPDTTQKARGVLKGVNLVLGMTILLVVLTVVVLVGAVAFDRFVTSRKRLAAADTAPVVEEEPQDEVVAGIAVGRAGVPRWLYAFYVLIPLFAITYVFSNVSIASHPAKPHKKVTAPAGPLTKATVVAAGIKFDVKELTLKANSPITIDLNNKDTGVPHTFTVWKSQADATANNASAKIADTGPFNGTKTLNFNTQAPATWFFNCTIHPTSMFGTIKVAEGGATTGAAAAGPVTEAKVVAKGIKFDVKSLDLKANSPITIDLDNQDTGVPHTFTVWKSEADATANNSANKVADSGQFSTKAKLNFKTGPPGKWYFNCTIHPTSMFGTITVQ